jgi:hypothetical protein
MKKTFRLNPGLYSSLIVLLIGGLLTEGYTLLALNNHTFDWSVFAFAGLPLTAAVILYRHPRSPVGWLLSGIGIFFLINNAAREYGYYTLITRPGSLPYGDIVTWSSSWSWIIPYPLIVGVILLFPNGHLLARRWWLLLIFVTLAAAATLAFVMPLLLAVPGASLVLAETPTALGEATWGKVYPVLFAWQSAFLVSLILALVGMGVRFHHSRGVERQQLKWVLFSMIPIPLGALGYLFPEDSYPILSRFAYWFNFLATTAIPIAIGFAMLRYRLYDIDFIIRRTLVYTLLTATLALVYMGSVVLLGTLLTQVNSRQPAVVIVLSTLIIGALFQPLRQRFQNVIDRRFYRRKYNSGAILEHFTVHLRVETDFEAINDHLLQVVGESLQPDSVSLWLVNANAPAAEEKPANLPLSLPERPG